MDCGLGNVEMIFHIHVSLYSLDHDSKYSTNPMGSQNPDGELQRFLNPVLKLFLDVKRSEAGDHL